MNNKNYVENYTLSPIQGTGCFTRKTLLQAGIALHYGDEHKDAQYGAKVPGLQSDVYAKHAKLDLSDYSSGEL